jgi:agmatine/peptidylarginine deiminase
LCPQGLQSSSTITLTGQNLTDLLAPDLDEGVLLKQDLEKEETDEHVEACADFASKTEFVVVFVADDDTFDFFVFPLEVKSEFKKLASLAPGEMGCFDFFISPYKILKALDFVLPKPFSFLGF